MIAGTPSRRRSSPCSWALRRAPAQQGGAPAPDSAIPVRPLYPGDGAAPERIARWMARGAGERGVPLELPVMAGLAESGLRNLRGKPYAGFFGMHRASTRATTAASGASRACSSTGSSTRAALVRQRRVAEGGAELGSDPAATASGSPTSSGRPPRTAAGTSATSRRPTACSRAVPPADHVPDAQAPALRVRAARRQRDAIEVRVSCPSEPLHGGRLGDARPARAERVRGGRSTRRRSRLRSRRARRSARLTVTVTAADEAGNQPASRGWSCC